MIPDQHRNRGQTLVPLYSVHMVKALVALGMRRRFCRRESRNPLICHQNGVFHTVLGAARMDINPMNRQGCRGGVEIFVFDLSQLTSVHRIRRIRAEGLYVKAVGSAADLLIRRKADGQPAVRQLGVFGQIGAGRENFGNAGLVVGPQQRAAIGDNEPLPDIARKARKRLCRNHRPVCQPDIPAFIRHRLRPDTGSADIRGGIHMCEKAQHRPVFISRCGGQPAEHIAVFVHPHIRKPQCLHLLRQSLPQHPLPRSAREALRMLIRTGIIGNVFQKALCHIHLCSSVQNAHVPFSKTGTRLPSRVTPVMDRSLVPIMKST